MAVVTALAVVIRVVGTVQKDASPADAFSDPERPTPQSRSAGASARASKTNPLHLAVPWIAEASSPQQFIKTGQLMIGWADNQRRVNCKVRHGILSAEISCHVFHLS